MTIQHNRFDVGTTVAYPSAGTPQVFLAFDGKLVTIVNLDTSREVAVSFDRVTDEILLTPGTPLAAVKVERQTCQKIWFRNSSGVAGAGQFVDVVVEG